MLVRFLVALVPLSLTPILVWLFAEGYLNAGGGEKDILLAVPWLVWSIAFSVAFLATSGRQRKMGAAGLAAAGWATIVVLSLWLVLYVWASDWLGVE